MKERINALIAEYQHIAETIDQDLRESESISVSNLIASSKAMVYRRVIEDLTGILEGEEDE